MGRILTGFAERFLGLDRVAPGRFDGGGSLLFSSTLPSLLSA
jgi:hypothetical protein